MLRERVTIAFVIIRIVVTLTLGTVDLAQVRFAFSPLWECVAAFRAWRDPGRHAVHLPWAAAVDDSLRRLDWALLELVACPAGGAIPDFLAPPPATPLARFDEELAAARRTPPKVVRRELAAAYPAGVPPLLADLTPETVLAATMQSLDTFWRLAVAAAWPRIAARLEAEVVFRARALALGGPAALFDTLHRTVRYVAPGPGRRDGTLYVEYRETYSRQARGAGLLLVPSVFAWPDVFVAARPPWRPTIAYPARGVGDLWQGSSPGSDSQSRDPRIEGADVPSKALVALLGVARARVLARLETPQTTAELAAGLGLAPATASSHLVALWRAGVVDRTRVGRRVYYALNVRSQALLRALAADVL
jgi:DNA-binding transcriptional ArsR family regulator